MNNTSVPQVSRSPLVKGLIPVRRSSAFLEPVALQSLRNDWRKTRLYNSHPMTMLDLYDTTPPPAVFHADNTPPSQTTTTAPIVTEKSPPSENHSLQIDNNTTRDSQQHNQWLAQHEHNYRHLPFNITLEQIDSDIGRSVGLYFRSCIALTVAVFLLGIPGVVEFVLQCLWSSFKLQATSFGVYDLSPWFYIGYYSPDLLWIWRGGLILIAVITFILPFLHYWYVHTHARQFLLQDRYAGQMGNDLDPNGVDAFTANHQLSKQQRCVGKFQSGVWFVMVLSVEILVNFGIIFYMTHTNHTLLATILAIVLAIFNALWQLMCEPATNLERPLNATDKYNSYFSKAYIFQMLCGAVMVCFTHFSWLEQWQLIERDECPLVLLAHKYLLTLIISIVTSCIVQVIIPVIQIYLVRHCCRNRAMGNATYMPEFILGDELVLDQYVLFLTIQGSSVFPLIPLVSGLLLIFKYHVSKYRMLRLCKPMIVTNNTFTTRLIYWTTVTILLAYLLQPTGVLWIWRGDRYQNNLNCKIYLNL